MTTSQTDPAAEPTALVPPALVPPAEPTAELAGPTGPTAPGVLRTTNGTERRKERGVVLRVLVYVVVAHLLAFYLWLMFAVIGKH